MNDYIDIGSFSDYLKDEWLDPLGITPYKLAMDLGISSAAMSRILSGKNRMSEDTCCRLARYFSVSQNYFVNMQSQYLIRSRRKEFEEEVRNLPVYDWSAHNASSDKHHISGLLPRK